MPKRRDEVETAFDALQEILRRDAERDKKSVKPNKAKKRALKRRTKYRR